MSKIKEIFRVLRQKLEYDTLGYYRNVLTIGNNNLLLNNLHQSIFNKINVFYLDFNPDLNTTSLKKENLDKVYESDNDGIQEKYLYQSFEYGKSLFTDSEFNSLQNLFENDFDGFVMTPLELPKSIILF